MPSQKLVIFFFHKKFLKIFSKKMCTFRTFINFSLNLISHHVCHIWVILRKKLDREIALHSCACECESATSICLIPTTIDPNFNMPKPSTVVNFSLNSISHHVCYIWVILRKIQIERLPHILGHVNVKVQRLYALSPQ